MDNTIGYFQHYIYLQSWKIFEFHLQLFGTGRSICFFTFIFVFDRYFIIAANLIAKYSLHHKHQLVVCDVFIVDWNASYVITQLDLYDKFTTEVQLRKRSIKFRHCTCLKQGRQLLDTYVLVPCVLVTYVTLHVIDSSVMLHFLHTVFGTKWGRSGQTLIH